MKFSAVVAILAASSGANAFAPSFVGRQRSSSLRVASDDIDASALIAEATRISKKHGAQSVEARLAWEAVEEVNAADNSVATKASMDVECDVTEEMVNNACEEYHHNLEEMNDLLKATPHSPTGSSAADKVKPIKLQSGKPKPGVASANLQAALKEAKSLTAQFGIRSAKARVAWETVEEIAAADEHANALGGKLTDDCIVDAAQEACAALEEINRALDLDGKN